MHGFTGTPFDMRPLAEQLHGRGFTVVGPALPGHCTAVEDLDETTWHEWYGGVTAAFDDLRRRCSHVAVAGLSMGALLALHLARERGAQVAALASLAVPLWLPPPAELVIALYQRTRLQHYLPAIPKTTGSDVRDPIMKRLNPGYRAVPARALLQLKQLAQLVRAELGDVRSPSLVMHGWRDHTAPRRCSAELAQRLGSATIETRWLPASYHLITIDIERDIVAREIARFFAAQMPQAS